MVTRDGDNKKLPPTPLPKEAIQIIEASLRRGKRVQIVNKPELNPMARALFQHFELVNFSGMKKVRSPEL